MNPLYSFDQWTLHSLYALRTIADTQIAIGISELGSIWTIVGITAIIVLLFVRVQKYAEAASLASVVALTGGIVAGLKYLTHRARPDAFFQAYPEHWYSFPSWHATATMAVALFIALTLPSAFRGWRRHLVHFLLALLVLAVGFTRMYLGVHYATDVLAGWMLGALIAYVGIRLARYLRPRLG